MNMDDLRLTDDEAVEAYNAGQELGPGGGIRAVSLAATRKALRVLVLEPETATRFLAELPFSEEARETGLGFSITHQRVRHAREVLALARKELGEK